MTGLRILFTVLDVIRFLDTGEHPDERMSVFACWFLPKPRLHVVTPTMPIDPVCDWCARRYVSGRVLVTNPHFQVGAAHDTLEPRTVGLVDDVYLMLEMNDDH